MTSRLLGGVFATTLICAGSAMAQSWTASTASTAGPKPLATPGSASGGSPVLALLQKRVEGVNWEERTFEEILDWMRDEADGKVNIVPRWNPLSMEDVDRDKLVTLELVDTTIGEVVREVFGQLSDAGNVAFRGEGNTLRISTKADFDQKLELRIYDVTDILFRVPDFSESAPQVDLQRRQTTGGGGGGGQPIFANAGGQNQEELSEEGDQDPEEILEDLATLIRETISPDSWQQAATGRVPGPGRIIGYGKRSLVVLNTVDVHEQIAGYFSVGK